jgi:hypothetical protein
LVSGGIRGSCQLLGPISPLHYPHPVGGVLRGSSPLAILRSPQTCQESTARPLAWGNDAGYWSEGRAKLSNGHALFREVNTDPMYREANHLLASAPVEVPCTPCTFFPFLGRTSPGLVLRRSSRLAPAYPRWLRLPAPHSKTARSLTSPFAHKGRLDSRGSSRCPEKGLPAARS